MELNNQDRELFKSDFQGFKDALLVCFGTTDTTDDDAMILFSGLPEDVKSLAYKNGVNDIVFLNFAIAFMSETSTSDTRDNYVLMDINPINEISNVTQLRIPAIPKK